MKNFVSLVVQNVPSEDSDQTVQPDLNLHWGHMAKGTLSDVAAPMSLVLIRNALYVFVKKSNIPREK